MKTSRVLCLLLVLWFALMQGMAPLLHAHTAGNTAADDGPHMHMVDIPALHLAPEASSLPFHWHMHADRSLGQVVVLGVAIEEKQPLWSLLSALNALWTALCLPVVFMLLVNVQAIRLRADRRSPPGRYGFIPALLHAPRAPPRA